MIDLKPYMIDVYVYMVTRGMKTIEQIPPEYMEVVCRKLAEKEDEKLAEEREHQAKLKIQLEKEKQEQQARLEEYNKSHGINA